MKSSPLLSFNPELQRGIWLELTASRLVAAPIVLVALLGAADMLGGPTGAVGIAKPVIWLLLILWGSRLAAESVDSEVAGRTWDLQRLSAQTPWALTLGKLFGGTVFVWYCAAFCAAAIIGLQDEGAWGTIGNAVLGGLTAQSTALFVALLLNRFNIHDRRTHTTFAQFAGILAAWQTGLLSIPVQMPSLLFHGSVTWYGYEVPGIVAITQSLSVLWLIFGSMRIVRRELGFIDGPMGWSLYTIYAVVLAAGFVPHDTGMATADPWRTRFSAPVEMFASQSLAWVVAVSLTYMAALGVPVSRIGLRKLSGAFAERDWREVWRNLPIWVPSAAMTTLVAVILSARLAATGIIETGALMPVSALGFLMRDVALIYLIRLTYRGRTVLALIVIYALLYAVLPFVLSRLSGGLTDALFYPGFHPGFGRLLVPWIEAAIAGAAVWRIWRTPPAAAR